tara:strand:+ start:70 stop:849 length:780 start_codon:yes stop_codon:yes gene_type:complete
MRITYTADHILDGLKRLQSIAGIVDPEVDEDLEFSDQTTIREWMAANDLIKDWRVQHQFFSRIFDAIIPADRFRATWLSKKSNLRDLAELLSECAPDSEFPSWRLGGIHCVQGSILKYIIARINRSQDIPFQVSGKTKWTQLTGLKDWDFVVALAYDFPEIIPIPHYIDHASLLPPKVRVIRSSIKWTGVASFLALFGAFFIGSIFGSAIFGATLLATIALDIAYKRRVKLPSTNHIVFFGMTDLRGLAADIHNKRHFA